MAGHETYLSGLRSEAVSSQREIFSIRSIGNSYNKDTKFISASANGI